MSLSPSVCAESPLSAALFVTMVGHKRRVRLSVEGLPCALLVKTSKGERSKLHGLTTVTNNVNLSIDL